MIGIAGCEHGLGTTHLCIALANYASSKHGQKTACLEMNDSAAFLQLSPCSARHCFSIYGVDYYPSVRQDEIPELMNRGYQYCLLDFGVLNTSVFDEFLRCDKKFLIGSAALWKRNCFSHIFQQYPEMKSMEFFYCMIQFGEKKDILKFAKTLSLSVWQFLPVPFLQNPFHIAKEYFNFFEKLL